MMRSLFSGVAGLKTHQTKMDVIGNNIANVNTIGFKSSSVTFQDIMYQNKAGASGATENLGGVNAKQTGLGVMTGATKISIESGGAAQSTGEAFDLRFTDQSSTNFFIVSNGSSNLFTRAGSFYIDGAGNLAMASTGYIVQGWQYNEETGNIQRDVVSPLRIMSPENRTSTPEATTDAYVSGVLDKNDPDIVSDNGYINTVTVYDNLGYEYICRFSTKLYDGDNQEYTTSLVSITNDKGEDVLDTYLGWYTQQYPDQTREDGLATIFGSTGKTDENGNFIPNTEKVSYSVSNPTKYPYDSNYGTIATKIGQDTYTLQAGNFITPTTAPAEGVAAPDYKVLFVNVNDPNDVQEVSLSNVYGMSSEKYASYLRNGGQIGTDRLGNLTVTYNAVNNRVKYDTSLGTLISVGDAGEAAVGLNLSAFSAAGLGEGFRDINLDFSSSLAYDNGGTTTMGMDRGQLANLSMGAGRKLGTLTGLSVSQDGTIWGSYDNGTNKCLGMIPVARFANASGLESLGNNCYSTTLNSGDFDGIGVDVTADGGQINSGQLEMSNVDLSQEFTEMITTQRGFQANSRIITVSDTMLEELTNLKR